MDVERAPDDGWIGVPQRPSSLNPLALPSPLTGRQRFYIFGVQGVGAALIDAAANFGIACVRSRVQSAAERSGHVPDVSFALSHLHVGESRPPFGRADRRRTSTTTPSPATWA